MSQIILEPGTIIYHGTIHDFDMNNITMPCWFSKYKEQAINHVRYKHFGEPNGFLLSYRIKHPTILYDISKDDDIRMDINVRGNYEVSHRFYYKQYGDEFAGYINLPDHGEIMLIRRFYIEPLNKINIELNKRIDDCNIDGQNWRMIGEKEEKKEKLRTNGCSIC
jgi:hypothetical protein